MATRGTRKPTLPKKPAAPKTRTLHLTGAQRKAFDAVSREVISLDAKLTQAQSAQGLALTMLGLDPARVIKYDIETGILTVTEPAAR